jgi:hypothetical protein
MLQAPAMAAPEEARRQPRPALAAELDAHARQWPLLLAELRWVLVAAGLGFAITAIGADLLRLPRPWLVLLLTLAVGTLTAGYVRSNRLDVGALLRHHWVWASIRGIFLGSVLVALALPSDSSSHVEGILLVFNILWLGAVYGTFDALLLNVLPMMATWRGLSRAGLTTTWPGRIAGSALTIGANLLVTTTYHLGYPEFRDMEGWTELTGPLGGNLMIGVGYVLAPNPLTSVLGHVILHIGAVLAGADGAVQLPPNY